jgi:molybdate transport system permease protein
VTSAPDAIASGSDTRPGVRRGTRRHADLGPVGVLLSVVALLFLGLPVAALLARAVLGGELLAKASERAVLDALVLSMTTTLASLVLAVVFGTPLALLLARREFRGKGLVEAIVDLPIVLPPTVAGLALLLALGRRGVLGTPLEAIGITIPFTVLAVVLAQTFVAAPLYVRSVRAGFMSVDRTVEEAAAVDGAGRLALLARVTMPLAAPAVAGGLALAWARALGEFGATIMFAGNIGGRTQTLPLVVYSEFQSSLDASIAAAAVLVVAALGVLVAVRLTRWRRGLDWRGMV